MENIADFKVNLEKCISCGQCTKVCPGELISLDKNRKSKIKEIKEFGWNGCWKCQHCLAVCPTGAISVLGVKAEECSETVPREKGVPVLDSLIRSRRSCRRYLDKNVQSEVIERILDTLQNIPNGGNKRLVEYTVIADKEQVKYFRKLVSSKMKKLAAEGIYLEGFDKISYEQMEKWQDRVRPDMFFCSAPHLVIPHAPLGKGCPVQDVQIACTYFDLMCAAEGLGSIMMTFPLDVLNLIPEVKKLLAIPDNHYIGSIIGFGYPEIIYKRGVKKEIEKKIHWHRFF